jgi:Icc-related predicted phosphoesterase
VVLPLAPLPILGQNSTYAAGSFVKILAVSDETIDRLYNTSVRETYPDVRMIFGCGDLPYSYLEFLVTIYNVPMYYVPGNHDPEFGHPVYSRAEGGTNLDGIVVHARGMVLAGLGGSIMYHPGGANQYTQNEMYLRAYRLLIKIFMDKIKTRRRLDILVTHSPPHGIHDDDDPAHHGLHALNFVLRTAKPRFMLHGHTIFYRQNLNSHITNYGETNVVNVYPFRLMDIDINE